MFICISESVNMIKVNRQGSQRNAKMFTYFVAKAKILDLVIQRIF